jgi:hypothetical protein
MIVIIIVRNDVCNQGRVADAPKHRRREHRAIEAVRFSVTQDGKWAAVPFFLAVFDGIKERLDAGRGREACKKTRFSAGQCVVEICRLTHSTLVAEKHRRALYREWLCEYRTRNIE